MGLKSLIVALAAAAMALGAVPAQAAKRHHHHYVGVYGESRDLPGVRTRIVVTRRSYLDAGTEVTPGTRKYLDYVEWQFRDNDYYNNWPSTFLNPYGRSPLPGTYFPWP